MLVVLYFLKFNADALMIFGIWFALITLPVIYMHIEYYLANRGLEIIIEKDEIRVSTKRGNTHKFKFAELSKVILYKSASLDKGGIPLTPMESYHFARIITKSENQIIVTCLMYPKLEEVIDALHGVKKIRKRGICTLSRN
jgi:hypothetical protein